MKIRSTHPVIRPSAPAAGAGAWRWRSAFARRACGGVRRRGGDGAGRRGRRAAGDRASTTGGVSASRRPRPSRPVARRSGDGGDARAFLLAKRLVGREVGLTRSPPRPTAGVARLGDLGAPTFPAPRPPRPPRRCSPPAWRAFVRNSRRAAARPADSPLKSAARAKGLGVWRDPDYAVLAADDLASLARRDGRFVIVEGVVRRVGLGRARLYLDLGGRGGFTVVASRKPQAALPAPACR